MLSKISTQTLQTEKTASLSGKPLMGATDNTTGIRQTTKKGGGW
jgi:hypothetical protein